MEKQRVKIYASQSENMDFLMENETHIKYGIWARHSHQIATCYSALPLHITTPLTLICVVDNPDLNAYRTKENDKFIINFRCFEFFFWLFDWIHHTWCCSSSVFIFVAMLIISWSRLWISRRKSSSWIIGDEEGKWKKKKTNINKAWVLKMFRNI